MNTTDDYGEYPEHFWKEHKPEPHQIYTNDWVAIVMYAVVFLLGVPGNGLVLWVTIFDMKRTIHTVWFINLAVADLLCCLSSPVAIMDTVVEHWPLGLFACKVIPSLLLVNMYASVLLLTVISIDRCIMVLIPMWCHVNRTLKKAYVACVVIWFLAFLMSSPSFVFRYTNPDLRGDVTCGYNYVFVHKYKKKVEDFIGSSRFLLGFVIPFLVITVCYSLLLRRIMIRFNQCNKSLKVALIVIVGFFICWLPYHVVTVILATNESTSALFTATAKIHSSFIALAFVNSCINPVIYGYMGQDYKGKFRRSVSARLKVALEEDMDESSDKKSKSSSNTKNTEDTV
ncbi:C5a anaphylatoxin chemotactic receptor 1-like isoform X2 [Hyperolius riggenbachi]|uniref:C5a anaphylatoxin chemotactic receptor 1-like isoform X2 n=1 Tax=Hyperolius riggenbachi TaxID=752182 RepID=UPI0035A39879